MFSVVSAASPTKNRESGAIVIHCPAYLTVDVQVCADFNLRDVWSSLLVPNKVGHCGLNFIVLTVDWWLLTITDFNKILSLL